LNYQTQTAFQTGIEGDLSRHTRGFFYFNRDPGFYRNVYLGDSGADRNEYYVSFKNRFVDSENWRITSSHLGLKTHNGYDVWSLNRPDVDDDFDTLSDEPGEDSVALHGHSLRLERKLDAENYLVSLSSLTRSESVYSYDADWGNNSYWQSIAGWNQPYDYFDDFRRARTAWHQKIFLKRRLSEAGLHLYGLNEDSDITHFKNKQFKENNSSRYDTVNVALFADGAVPLSEKDSLLLGGRYEAQTLRYTDTFLPGLRKSLRLGSWQTGWRHDFSERVSANATVSRGFKSPGFNVDNTDATIDRFYNSEFVTSYEVSTTAKTETSFWTTTLFLMDHRHKQVKVSRQDDPTDPGSFTYFTNNAARATSYGAEISAGQRWGSWQSEARVGLLKAEFRDYFFENQNRRGRDLAHAPTWDYSAGLTKNWSERFSTNATVTGKNDFAFSNNHDQRSRPYHLLDVGATYRRQRWSLSAFVKNVFDERYTTRGFYFANEPPDWENKLYVQYGPPRYGGVSLSYVF
jgi:iron complex outermembrane receptor protein